VCRAPGARHQGTRRLHRFVAGLDRHAPGGTGALPAGVVRGNDTRTVREHGPVVVAVDGTRNSEQAIAFAEAAARDQRLVAVHTWTDSVVDTALLRHAEPPDFVPAQHQAFELLAERLAGWQEKYPDVHVTSEVVRDHPSRALLRYAAGAALVVMGTRGRGGFRSLVLGSSGQHLLSWEPCIQGRPRSFS
jgi:nucleotide-binding universal stress UspA family protein